MPLPNIFTQKRRLLVPPSPLSPAANWVTVQPAPFPIQAQPPGLEWCWAAVTVSLVHHYNPVATLRQCEVANVELQHTDCCVASNRCNARRALSKVLAQQTTHLGQVWRQAVSFADVMSEIIHNRPLACAMHGSDTHFVVIWGFKNSSIQFVKVADPQAGSFADVAYNTFRRQYNGRGWLEAYFTKP